EMDIREKDKNKAKNDKTEHGNIKSVKSQSQSQSQPSKSKVNAEAKTKEILNGPTRTHLMGRWVFEDELEAPKEAPQPPREAPPSPEYVPGPEHPPLPDYVASPEYPEYLVPSDDEAPIEDHPLPADASPTTLSPGYEDEASKEDKDVEEEHLAPSDSTTLPAIDHVPLAKRIPSPSLHVSYPPLPLPSPIVDSLTYAEAQLGIRAAEIRIRAASPPLLLPSTSHKSDIPEAKMPPRKRACFTTPASGFEVGESSAAAAARQPGPTLEADLRRDRDTNEFYIRFEDAQDDRAFLRARVNILFKDRPYHRHTVMLLDKETSSLKNQLTTALGRIQTLEAIDPEPRDEPTEKMAPKRRTTVTTTTSTHMTDAQIKELIARGVVDALA
ncbi:hypothetical protein Tco_0838388, partial [Tanacetum coccineum]